VYTVRILLVPPSVAIRTAEGARIHPKAKSSLLIQLLRYSMMSDEIFVEATKL